MQRYESYRPSGIQWVEKIPSHWDVERAKWLFNRMERPIRPEDDVVTAFRDGQVTLRTNRRTEGFTNAIQEHGYQGIRKGDLVIHAMDAFAGAIGVSDSEGKSTPVYAACVPHDEYPVNSYYYAYLLRYMAHSGYIESLSKGIRERSTDFRFAEFRELPLPIPDKDEQDRIVAFLDQKTAEIDAAIAKKERLIELLQEQKKTIRNQVITKGLNLSALQCDSGVPWIGAIPSHWKVCAIKRLFKSMDYGLSESALGDGDFKYLNMGHIKDGKVSTENTGYLASAPDAILLRKNDILFNRTNSFDLVGKSGIYLSDEEDVTFASYMVRIRVKDEICPSWANSLMNSESYLSFIRTLALRSLNQANLNPTRLGAVSVPVPPKEEQEAIADYLDEMSTQVDISIRSIEKELCGLFEMKQTTIANVVTGKIKV